jgi:hypothetical protein
MAGHVAGLNPAIRPGHDELGGASLAPQHEGVLSEVIASNVITR